MSSRRKPPSSRATPNGSTSGPSPPPPPPPQSSTTASTMSPSTRRTPPHSPWLPTPLETLLLAAYPATLVLGSVFSLVDPASRAATYSAATQSYPADAAPSFFARKRNPFNVYFVKVGWLWTSAALLGFALTSPGLGPARAPLTPRRARAALRWAAATLWWAAVTQWCFGPALIDRGFSLTGGACALARDGGGAVGERIWSSRACRLAGGRWQGGHDISGHVFILITGSGMLLLETLPVLLRGTAGLGADRVVAGPGGRPEYVDDVEPAPVGPGAEKTGPEGRLDGLPRWAALFAVAVAGLEWLMLFMTAAYFHTWFEKFTGLLVSMFGLWVIYLLPRVAAPVRSVLGMPGV